MEEIGGESVEPFGTLTRVMEKKRRSRRGSRGGSERVGPLSFLPRVRFPIAVQSKRRLGGGATLRQLLAQQRARIPDEEEVNQTTYSGEETENEREERLEHDRGFESKGGGK